MAESGWHRKTQGTPAERERARQYNSAEYRAAKRRGQREVDNGTAACWRCGEPIPPGTAWHLGHDDTDRNVIHGPECVPCNLHAAAVKGAAAANTARTTETPRASRIY